MVSHVRMGSSTGPASAEHTPDPASACEHRETTQGVQAHFHNCSEGFRTVFTLVSTRTDHVVPSDWNSSGEHS